MDQHTKTSLIEFPNLHRWMLAGLYWQYPAMATIILLFSLRSNSYRKTIVSSFLASFLVLTIFNSMIYFFQTEDITDFMFRNILANFLGAMIIAIIITAGLIICDECMEYCAGNTLLGTILASFIIISCGIIFSAIIFYSAEFLYKPLFVEIEGYLAQPSGGYIFADSEQEIPETSEDRPIPNFQLFPRKIENGNILWNSPEAQLRVPMAPKQFSAYII